MIPAWHLRRDGNSWLIEDRHTNPPRVRLVAVVSTEAEAQAIAELPRLLGALAAVNARIKGEYDNPALVSFGALSADSGADCGVIAALALESLFNRMKG